MTTTNKGSQKSTRMVTNSAETSKTPKIPRTRPRKTKGNPKSG